MSTSVNYSFLVAQAAVLIGILMLVALWVGLIWMGRERRGGAWWVMLVGVSLLTLGPLFSAYGSYLIASTITPDPSTVPDYTYIGPSPTGLVLAGIGKMLIPLGIFIFGLGFAIHGLRVARTRTRLMELEQVTGAMSEELERIRKGGAA